MVHSTPSVTSLREFEVEVRARKPPAFCGDPGLNPLGDVDALARTTAEETVERRAKLIFVYNGDSGVMAMLLDAVKKAAGREDCALCEIVYSPFGKRSSWKECQARLGVDVREMHRDTIPAAWGVGARALPCVLIEGARGALPRMLLSRADLEHGSRDVGRLEALLNERLATATPEETSHPAGLN